MTLRVTAAAALNLFLLLFALSAILGVLPAYDPRLTVAALSTTLVGTLLFFSMTFRLRTESSVRALGVVLFALTTCFALYFITQYGYMGFSAKGGIISQLGQLTTLLPDLHGFIAPPNDAATALEVAVPLGVILTLSSQGRKSKILFAAGTLVIIYAIFLTASRGSWLSLGVTAVVGVIILIKAQILQPHIRTLALVIMIIALASFILILALGPDRLPFLVSTFSRASDRSRLFENSLYLAEDYAFSGIGIGDTFPMVYSRYSLLIQVPFLDHPHNLILKTWLGQGILGLGAWIGAIMTFYWMIYRTTQMAGTSPIFHGAWLGVTVMLMHSLSDAPPWVVAMLLGWMGLTAGSTRVALRSGVLDSQRLILHMPTATLLSAIAALAALFAIMSRPLQALWHTNLGAIAETRAELADGLSRQERQAGYLAAAAEYRAALEIDPTLPSANRRAGNLDVNLGHFEDAVPLLEAAYATEKSYPATVKGLGLAYTWVGQTAKAAQMFFLLDDPATMSNELYTWGNYRTQQNQPLLAAYAYKTAQAMYPETTGSNVWLLIADSYRAAGRLADARVWYNRVLETEPGNQRALAALAEIGP